MEERAEEAPVRRTRTDQEVEDWAVAVVREAVAHSLQGRRPLLKQESLRKGESPYVMSFLISSTD